MIPLAFSPNAEFIGSGRVLPSPIGSLEESKISGETMYKERESWQPIKNTTRPPPSCLLSLQYRQRGTKNVNMPRLPHAPTLEIHRGLRWRELDHHGLLRLDVNHERVVNK